MSTQQFFSQGVAGMRRSRLIAIAAVLAAGACSGCERSPHQASGGTSTAAPKRSPRATIERLLAARQSGSYQPMNELVVPGRVHEVVKTLMAVDEFLQANRMLCNYVRDEIALGLSQSIDHASWGARLDIFSPYVELVDEQIEGKTATVSFMVDGRLPLQRARLVLVNGQWRYDPGVGYDPQLPAAFQRMARGLRLVLDDLQSGRLSADTIRAAPARLIEEVRVRLLPGVMMLPSPTTQPDDD
jgi:hypothetical protein